MTELEEAIASDPSGAVCHFCGKENTFADDCGFFYILDPSEPLVYDSKGFVESEKHPACDLCYCKNSYLSRKIYGTGER